MQVVALERFPIYIDEAYIETSTVRCGAVCALVPKPFAYRVEAETWRASKGQLDHVWSSRERAFALIRLMSRLVDEGVITHDEAATVVREMGWGWHCPEHPLIPLLSADDVCSACVEEDARAWAGLAPSEDREEEL